MMHRISTRNLSLLLAALFLRAYPSPSHGLASSPKTYNYFAFGSNMASSTMTNLRGLTPLASSAAVLPGHALRFNIPGMPGIEPSSAAVEPVANYDAGGMKTESVVHGVLYKLTEEDFSAICSTEGVPFAYSLHRCRVVPYMGDGETAGEDALRRATSSDSGSSDAAIHDGVRDTDAKANMQATGGSLGVSAFTLRAARKQWRQGKDIPPSQSYLNVLIRGAKEFKLDRSYLRKLESTQVGRTWIGNGLAEGMLSAAERRNSGTR